MYSRFAEPWPADDYHHTPVPVFFHIWTIGHARKQGSGRMAERRLAAAGAIQKPVNPLR